MYVLDPTAEANPAPVSRASRLDSLHQRRIGLLSNGKVAVAPLFDHLESLLRREWKAKEVRRLTKGNYSAPAEPALIRELARCHLIFTGVGDLRELLVVQSARRDLTGDCRRARGGCDHVGVRGRRGVDGEGVRDARLWVRRCEASH